MSRSVPLSALVSALVQQPWSWFHVAWTHPVAMICMVLGLVAMTLENVGVPDVAVFGEAVTLRYLVDIGLMIAGVGFFGALATEWGLRRTGWWPRQQRLFATAVIVGVGAFSLYGMPDAFLARLYPYLFWQGAAIALTLYFAFRPPREAPPETAALVGWYGGLRVMLSAGTTWLLASLLGAGVTVALFALDELLGIDMPDEVIVEVWILAYGLVWPMAFLAGAERALPEDVRDRPPIPETPPRWIAVTVGWALIPLALLYLAILYVYLVQLVFGMATDLVSVAGLNAAYLAFGVATHTAALPLARAGNTLALVYRRIFPWSIPLPLSALIWAVSVRLFEYGMTEPRAILTVVVLWLGLLLLVWMVRGAAAGPATPVGLLGVLLLFSGNGHWGAQALSMGSQYRALNGLLQEHGMINEAGQAVPADETVPDDDQARMAALLHFFEDRGSNFRLAALFPDDHMTAPERIAYLDIDRRTVALDRQERFAVNVEPPRNAVAVTGFDTVVRLTKYGAGLDDGHPIQVGPVSLVFDGPSVTVHPDPASGAAGPLLRLDLTPVVTTAFETRAGSGEPDVGYVDLRPEAMQVDAGDGAGWRARLAVDQLVVWHDGREAADGATIHGLEGLLLLDAPDGQP